MVKPGPHDMEGADQVDVDHHLETVGRQIQRRAQEIPCRARDQHVKGAERIMGLRHGGLHLLHMAHIAGDAQHAGAMARQIGLGLCNPFGIAAHDRDIGAGGCKTMGDAKVYPAGSTGDKDCRPAEVKS